MDTYERFAALGSAAVDYGDHDRLGRRTTARPFSNAWCGDIYRLWFASPRMAGITWWNLGDGTAYGNEGIAGGGLADVDFNPKPAYRALDKLINQDWKTQLETTSSADGHVRFRGFHGGYQITVKTAGRTKTFELAVRSGEPTRATLTIP